MKKLFLWVILTFVLSGCGEATATQPLQPIITSSPAKPNPLPTATRRPPTPIKIYDTQVPTLTLTPGPIFDSQGNISWHPQEVLIASEVGGGDGAGFDYPPEFVLLWDGTLLQQGMNILSAPFISKLANDEMCKILNTVDSSGFFEEPQFYNFPFDGASSQYITVNAWRSNSSGAQLFSYALSGAPYYDGSFCSNCPIPSEETIIQPGLANVYFLLKNYISENRKLAPIEKILVYFDSVEDKPTHDWPITSISPSELVKRCAEAYCYDVGLMLDGSVAKEFQEKIRGDQVFMVDSFMNSLPFKIRYRAIWPYEPSIMYYSEPEESQLPGLSPDYTLTCSASAGQYPILPLNKANKYWFYAPDGSWGAEVIDEPEQKTKIRVVNKFGYEKIYQYDPLLFGQSAIQVIPRFATDDGEYFFVNILPGDFDTQINPFVNSIGLQRISIGDGKVDYIFAGVEKRQFAFSMSENGGQVAYIRQGDQPLKIVIKDTYSGSEKAATLVIPANGIGSYTNAGTIMWSSDNNTLYIAATYRENGIDNGRLISIVVSNPARQTIIYESNDLIRLHQSTLFDPTAGICPLAAEIDEYCRTRLNLEDGSIR